MDYHGKEKKQKIMKNSEKFHYIGEVSKTIGVPEHIIRFWEKQFSVISPLRDHRGHRIYTQKDIEIINNIKFLVYNKGYRIEGVKKKLRDKSGGGTGSKGDKKFLMQILKEIKEIKKCLQ